MTVPADTLVDALCEAGVTLFTGVPDSLMKPLCAHVLTLPPELHLMQANEGTAVAFAAGHALDGWGTAAVYLQNSGIGNAVNPLLSLAAPEVMGLSMLLIIGWRGAPGHHDEPQHVLQGRVLTAMLDAMEVPHATLPEDPGDALALARELVTRARDESRPVALLVPPGGIGPGAAAAAPAKPAPLSALRREEAIATLLDAAPARTLFVATTGKTARELWALREARGEDHARDILVVGSMGHASSIALGLALRRIDRPVWCLDGDGAALMHLGALPVAAAHAPPGFVHVLFNNGVHESVGGQPLPIPPHLWSDLARAAGYGDVAMVDAAIPARRWLEARTPASVPGFLEVRVAPGSRGDLPRPSDTPGERRDAFRAGLKEE